jgi:hypothetical protein
MSARRPPLSAVPAAPRSGGELDRSTTAAFCSHCGKAPPPDSAARVCDSCGMGVILQAPAETAPAPGDPFLVVEAALTVGALSRQAEDFLGVAEVDVVNRTLTELILPAEADSSGPSLASAVMWAARGDGSREEMFVRPANTFGVRWRARIGPCGPPQAALLVLGDA